MDGRSPRGRTKPAPTGRAVLREPPWWAISIGRGCVTTLLQSPGILRIFRVVLTAVAARTISGALEATVCSIVLPLSSPARPCIARLHRRFWHWLEGGERH